MKKKILKAKRNPALEKHVQALAGTDFEECAPCPGCAGKIEDGNKMKCSRAGAAPVLLTAAQAQACDGTKPVVSASNEHKVYYLVPKPVREPVEQKVAVLA